MAVPKKKISRSKGRIRRGQKKLKLVNFVVCKNCNKLKKLHYNCEECINYK